MRRIHRDVCFAGAITLILAGSTVSEARVAWFERGADAVRSPVASHADEACHRCADGGSLTGCFVALASDRGAPDQEGAPPALACREGRISH